MRDSHGYPLPVKIAGREAMFEFAPQLLDRGRWVCLNVLPDVPWPVRPQSLCFAGHTIWIIPVTAEDHPGVAINCPDSLGTEHAERLLYRLLSVLSWREETGFVVAYRTGGNLPRMVGLNQRVGICCAEFDLTEVVGPEEEEPRLALALMREARGLNHHGYAFLTFWRVIELAFPKTLERRAWMQNTLPVLKGYGVQEAFLSITSQGITDIGWHLFESGRCAVAHATEKPIINPDDPRDALRLERELPIVREMATKAIEDRFCIYSRSTEHAKHLYELKGWKTLLGDKVLAYLNQPSSSDEEQTIDLPLINVRLHGNKPYMTLEAMVPQGVEVANGALDLFYGSTDHLFTLRFRLSFSEERLIFDIFNGLYQQDNGSVLAAERRIDIEKFFRDYMMNGKLQIWNADNGDLLSRRGAYIPLNMTIDLEACNAKIAAAEAEAEKRRSPPSHTASAEPECA